MEYRIIYITCKDKAEAIKIGKAIVRDQLAACANILDPMTSIYWWKGELEEDNETVLILKTHAGLVDNLIQKVKTLHSYDVPAILALPILDGNPEYLTWLKEETKDSGGPMPT